MVTAVRLALPGPAMSGSRYRRLGSGGDWVDEREKKGEKGMLVMYYYEHIVNYLY